MTEIERIKQENPIHVTLGEPFNISPTFTHPEKILVDSITVETIPLRIERLGKGSIDIMQDLDLWENLDLENSRNYGLPTPAGSIHIQYCLEANQLRIVPETVPLNIDLTIEESPQDLIERIICTLRLDGIEYRGEPILDPQVYPNEELIFALWTNSEGGGQLCFPRDPEIFKRMQFVIDIKKPESPSEFSTS